MILPYICEDIIILRHFEKIAPLWRQNAGKKGVLLFEDSLYSLFCWQSDLKKALRLKMDPQVGVPAKVGKKRKAAGTFTFHNHNVENYSPTAKQCDNLKRSQTFTVSKEQKINLSAEDASKNYLRVSIVDLVQYYETKLKTAQQESTQCKFLLAEARSKMTVLEKDLKEKNDELATLREAVKCPIGKLTYKEYNECSPEYMQYKRGAVKKWFSTICREGLPSSWKPLKVIFYFLSFNTGYKISQ